MLLILPMHSQILAIGGLLLLLPSAVRAGCCDPQTPSETFRAARAVGEYRVVSTEPVRGDDGRIHTHYQLSLTQSLKGDAPADLKLGYPGGQVGDVVEQSSLNPGWSAGEDQILHLQQAADGTWQAAPFRNRKNTGTPEEKKALRTYFRNGAKGLAPKQAKTPEDSGQENAGVPGSRLTTTGYFETSGVPCRFTNCDSNTPISCIVDIDPTKLPVGTNTAAALQIVQNALNAWSGASSLKFKIEGTASFGAGADTIATSDFKLRIQLHDSFNRIPSTSTLGIGGGAWSVDPGSGATIAGRTFNRRKYGYVVLNHRSDTMTDPLSFAEVLTHEIGHSLGLQHSSNSSIESEPLLEDATMYYAAHEDGRGAAIRLYDQDRIAYGYPLNTPPYSMDRTLRVVTGSPQPTGYGVDRITLSAYDLQTPSSSLTASLLDSPAGFTLSGNTLSYAAPLYGDQVLTDSQIAGGTYYDLAYFQVSDGVNLSPKQKFIITGYHYDGSPSDGLPDSWLTTYFGTTTPGAVGTPRHPDSDPDGDGLTNRVERYLGTDPTQPSSGLPKLTYDRAAKTLSFTPMRFFPHVVESSSNLSTWTNRLPVGSFDAPSMTTLDVSADTGAKIFYRLNVTP